MSKGRVLVVDDEPDVLGLCVRALEAAGYEAQGSTNGREAISLGKKQPFDVLLTDINMPDIKGLDVARAIQEFIPDITCVTMTGFGTMDLAIEALKLGVDEFIIKPFGPDELILAVSRALEKQWLRRENARLKALIPVFELNKTFMTTVNEESLCEHVVRIARQETGGQRASLSLFTPNRGGNGNESQRVISFPPQRPTAKQ